MDNNKLSPEQQRMVESYLHIVQWVIKDHITVNESICGFGFSDLFQEGCLALIKAVKTYDAARSSFETYARIVVKSGLLLYCKRMYERRKMVSLSGVPCAGEDDSQCLLDVLAAPEDTELLVDGIRIIELLESFLPEYSGVARKGIEAIILQMKGYRGVDIARMYGVAQCHVGAWIGRARKKLLANERFMSLL